MVGALRDKLAAFAAEAGFRGKGPLCVALVVTQHAKTKGLPLNADILLTEGGGQVLGLGRAAVQTILGHHGISRVLAEEGGRTSRGSIKKMREYVAFLNKLAREGDVDLEVVENFWIERVREFFASQPLKIKLDAARGLRMVVRDVIAQAVERQRTAPGMSYAGAVLEHLVGAKLDCALGRGSVHHKSFSTADAPSPRRGDFLIEDVIVHVTTSPSEAVIEKCRENLNQGYRPILVTLQRGVTVAEELAGNAGLAERIEIFEIEQFITLNLYEWAEFRAERRKTAVTDLVERYNEIVGEYETDPSLKIELRR